MSDRYDFVLNALFDLEPVKRFECRSDVSVLRSASLVRFDFVGGV